MKPCPYCGEDIKPAAVKCRFCGEWLDPDKVPAWAQVYLSQQAVPAPAAAKPVASEPEPEPEPDAPQAASVSTSTPANRGDEDTPSMRAWEPPPWIKKGRETTQPEEPSRASDEDASGVTAATAEDSSETMLPADDDEFPEERRRSTIISHGSAEPRREPEPEPEPPAVVATAADTVSADAAPDILPADSAPGMSVPAGDGPPTATMETVTQVLPKVGRAAQEALPRDRNAVTDTGDAEDDSESAAQDKPSDAAALLASFMGDDDDDDDDDDDAGFEEEDFGDMATSNGGRGFNPMIAVGGAAAIGALLFVFRAQIFGVPTPDVAAEADSAVAASGATEAAPTGATGADVAAATGPSGATGTVAAATGANAATGAAPTGANAATGAAATGATAPTGAATPTGDAAPTGAAAQPGLLPDGPSPTVGAPADPAAFEAVMEGARDAYMSRRLKRARKKLAEAMQLSPNNPEALELLSHIELDSGDHDAAMATAGTCLKVDASKPDCWLALAVIHEERKNYAQALSAWEKYIEISPDGTYASHGKASITRLRSKVN